MGNSNQSGNQQVVNVEGKEKSGDLNREFLDIIKLYSTGIVSTLNTQKIWFILLTLGLIGSMACNMFLFWKIENYAERISRRHWELTRYIDVTKPQPVQAQAKE